MRTHFITEPQIAASVRGLFSHLQWYNFKPGLATEKIEKKKANAKAMMEKVVWVPIGKSGTKILECVFSQLKKIYPEYQPTIDGMDWLVGAADTKAGHVEFCTPEGTKNGSQIDLNGRDIVIVDGLVRSGKSMSLTHAHVCQMNAETVTTYAVAVKSGSEFFPDCFSTMATTGSRVFIQREMIPGYRLPSGVFQTEHANVRKYLRDNSPKDREIRRLCNDKTSEFNGLMVSSNPEPTDEWYYCQTQKGVGAVLAFRVLPKECKSLITYLHRFTAGKGNHSVLALTRFLEAFTELHRCRIVEAQCIAEDRPLYARFDAEGYMFDKDLKLLTKTLY